MSKHRPATKQEFLELCLRNLGKPVLDINVSDDQVLDCVEESFKYYVDYHFDGAEHVYYQHVLTQEEIDTRSFIIPDDIQFVVDIVSAQSGSFATALANVPGGYEFLVDMSFNMSNGSLVSYYMNQSYYNLLQQVLYGLTSIRFSRHTNTVRIDNSMNTYHPGDIIIVDCYQSIDAEEFTDVWNDRWLIKYCTAKIKQKWGHNLSKFAGMQLPGGLQFDGTKYYDDATAEIQQLEDEMRESYSLRPRDFVG